MHMYEKKSIMPTVLFLAFNSVSWGDLSTEHTHLPCFFLQLCSTPLGGCPTMYSSVPS